MKLELQNQSQFVLNSIKLHKQLERVLTSFALTAKDKANLFYNASLYSSKNKASADVFYNFAINYFSSRQIENTVSLIENFLKDYLFHVEYVVGGIV